MSASLVVFVFAFAFAGATPTGECQQGCDCLTIPPSQCLLAYENVLQLFGRSQSISPSTTLSDCNRDTIGRLLEILCSYECLAPFRTYRICTNNPNGEREVNFTLSTLCSRHADDLFCAVKILEEVTNGSLLPPCAAGDTCDSVCQESYRNLSNRLGYCGGSWYDNPDSPFTSTFRQRFTTCSVTLGGR